MTFGIPTIGDRTEQWLDDFIQQRLQQQPNLRALVNRAVADSAVPAGVVAYTAAASAPDGYLLGDGSVYNIADYPVLGGLLGSTYGGDGVSTFGVPDLAQRFVLGVAGSGTGSTLGETGGVIDLALTFAGTTGADNESTTAFADSALGAHDRSVAVSPHDHDFSGTTDPGNPPYVALNPIIKI